MTFSMEKLKKYTSQIFYFGNFVTEICAKYTERFSKSTELKNPKIDMFIIQQVQLDGKKNEA